MVPKGKKNPRLPSWCRIVREATPEVVKLHQDRLALTSPSDAVALITPRLGREEVEVFVVVLLNAQMRVIAFQEVTRGLVNSTMVHPREVFRLAIAYNAFGIIIAHNHPSGDVTPSREDAHVTKQLTEAGELLDIQVLDHLIVSIDPNVYSSFAKLGMM